MNIFETIGSVTSGIERYHSQFLADALRASLCEDRSLFDGVWCLATPQGWEPPDSAEISTEEAIGDGRRIDICIRSDHPDKRIIGIEVKTSDDSVEFGQLKGYLKGLQGRFPEYCVQVSYLTPFNRCRKDDAAQRLHAVEEFKEFQKVSLDAQHVSWLDVADISWDGSDLWKQHQAYVRKHISSRCKLKESSVGRNRGLDKFFGEETAQRFIDVLYELEFRQERDRMEIDLSAHCGRLSSFAENLVDALKILLKSDRVSRDAKKADKFTEGQREPFLDDSPYREIHERLFGLSEQCSYVWIQGEGNYGVRTAHKVQRSSGVSLVTSKGPDRLVVELRR